MYDIGTEVGSCPNYCMFKRYTARGTYICDFMEWSNPENQVCPRQHFALMEAVVLSHRITNPASTQLIALDTYRKERGLDE